MAAVTTSGLVIVLGGINMDLVAITPRFPAAGETVVGDRFLTYPGGKGANQAVASAMMGADTLMVGRVGDDQFGPELMAALRSKGVNVAGVGIVPDVSSGIAVIAIDGSAQNSIIQILGANNACDYEEVEYVSEYLDRASTLMLQLETPIGVSLEAAREARARGKTVILDPGPVRPIPQDFYHCCNVITPNETEAQALVGFPVTDRESAARAAQTLLDRGVELAVVTLGAQGAVYATGRMSGYVAPFPVTAVDSVAAGDAFNGALAAALARGEEAGQAVRIASAAGALAVTKSGAQSSMPSEAEVAALLQSHTGA